MRFLKATLLFIPLFFANISFAENLENRNVLRYEFIKLKDGYAFTGKFFIKADVKCLIDLIFEPTHIKAILKNKYAVDVIRRDGISYDICYTYKMPFIEIKSTYRKILKLSEKKVIFELIKNEQKGVFLPRILSSEGNYQISQGKDGYWVEYYQESKIENSGVRSIFLFFAKSEAIKFLKDLKGYAERTCH